MAIPGTPVAPNGDGLKAVHAIFSSYTWQEMGTRLFWALVILAATFILVKIFQLSFEHARRRFRNGAQFIYIVEKLGAYTLTVVGILAAISSLGVSLGSLTIFAGAIGVGLGLGLQGIVKEFVAGIVLIFDSTIEVGDFIELEDGIRGEVMEIGPRATRIRSNDELHIIIPNFTVMQSRVRNWTYNDGSRRVHIPFSVADGSDHVKVRDIVLEAARKLPMTLPDDHLHKTQVWLTGFAGAGLDFDLVVWPTRESSRHPRTVHAAYTWAIYEALRAAGIQNANEQMDINMTSLFGRQGDEALTAIRENEKSRRARPHKEEKAPNDAIEAMRMDETRQASLRETQNRDAPRRER